MEAADDRIRLADVCEASAVDVEGEDPGHLIGWRPSGGVTHDFADDTLAVLADTDADRGPRFLHRERQVQVLTGALAVGGGGESLQEAGACLEREGSYGDQLEALLAYSVDGLLSPPRP